MTKTEEPTAHERELYAAEQRAERLRAELAYVERMLNALREGKEVEKPQVKHYTFYFEEPVIALALTLNDVQADLLGAIFRANGIHGKMHVRNARRAAENA